MATPQELYNALVEAGYGNENSGPDLTTLTRFAGNGASVADVIEAYASFFGPAPDAEKLFDGYTASHHEADHRAFDYFAEKYGIESHKRTGGGTPTPVPVPAPVPVPEASDLEKRVFNLEVKLNQLAKVLGVDPDSLGAPGSF